MHVFNQHISMNNPTHAYIQEYIEKLSKQLGKKKIRLLDFGCGSGSFLRTIPISSIESYTGYDINADSIREADRLYKRNKKIHFYTLNQKKPFTIRNNDNVDIVLMIGVIQYLTDRQIASALSLCKKVIKKNGFIIISTCSDHWFYRLIDLYGYVSPHRFISSSKIKFLLNNAGFQMNIINEIGLIIAPVFSYCLSLLFDGLDILFRTKEKGSLGVFGEWARRITAPLILIEYQSPLNFGYTKIIIAQPKV